VQLVRSGYSDSVGLWRLYERRVHHQRATIEWGEATKVGHDHWYVSARWTVAGQVQTARWFVAFPLEEIIAAGKPFDGEITSKNLGADNAVAKTLDRLPVMSPRGDARLAVWAQLVFVRSRAHGQVTIDAGVSPPWFASWYLTQPTDAVALLRGRTWLRHEHKPPRALVFNSHTRIHTAGSSRRVALADFLKRNAQQIITGNASWNTPPKNAAAMSRTPVDSFTIT